MKMKKFLAAIAACAVVSASMVMTVSAATAPVTSEDYYDEFIDGAANGELWMISPNQNTGNRGLIEGCGLSISDVYGVRVTLANSAEELADTATWFGGGIGTNSGAGGGSNWVQTDWSNHSEGEGKKELFLDPNGVITLKKDAPLFAETDQWGYIWIQRWANDGDNVELKVKSFELLDASGNVIDISGYQAQAPAETTPSETEATTPTPSETEATTASSAAATTAAATTKAAAAATTKANPTTGESNTGVALAVTAAMAAAGVAVTFGKKKK